MRSTLVLILSLVILGSAATAAPAATSVALDLTDCHYLESINQVPGALVDPLVPDGDFSVAGLVNLVVGMARCHAETSDGRTDEVTFGWADVGVNPRAGLRSPAGGLHLYRIEHLAMDDLYGAAHAQFGAQCRVLDDASVLVSLTDAHASTIDDGASAWDIRVPVGAPEDGTGGSTHYREFGPAQGGYAYLEGDLINDGAAAIPGTFTVDEGSPLSGLWGPAWVSPVQVGSRFAITGTTISFIPDATSPTPTETC